MLFHAGIALLAGALLAYELVLLRLFRLAQGSEFTQIAISIALLGFGASGTLLALAPRFARRHARLIAVFSAPLAGAAMLGAFFIGQMVPFRPEFLVWGGRYVWQLILWTLPLCVPFLIGATGLGVVFLRWRGHTRSFYAANLLGSGIGAGALYLLLHVLRPEDCVLLFASLTSFAGALMAARWRPLLASALAVLGVAGLIVLDRRPLPEIRLSDTRALWQLRQLPDARTVQTLHSPDGRVDLIASEAIHYNPGASLMAPPLDVPLIAICLDGDMVGVVFESNPFQRASAPTDQSLEAVPWATLAFSWQSGSAMMLNVAGELELRRPSLFVTLYREVLFTHPCNLIVELIRNSAPVWVLRMSSRLSSYLPRELARIDGESLDSLAAVRVDEGARDLIVEVSSGANPLSPDLLKTAEGFAVALQRLAQGGQLVLATPIDQPPRSSLRVLTLAHSVISGDPSLRLYSIRSFSQLAVAVLKPALPDPADAERAFSGRVFMVRSSSEGLGFDDVWVPTLDSAAIASTANRFNVLEPELFHSTTARLFSGETEQVYREYPFDLRPPTEWWPFFWQPFKPATLGNMLIGRMPQGVETIPEANAVMALIHALRILVAAAFVLVLLPLFWVGRTRTGTDSHGRVFLYFSGLGVGYLMLELLMIFMVQRLLGSPVLAASVTVAAFLIFSGLGSLSGKRPRWLFLGIILFTGLAVGALELCIHRGAHWPFAVRLLIAIGTMAPMAFLMGIPFPSGLQRLSNTAPSWVPWAWGVNGFASVVTGPAQLFLALVGGYQLVLAIGLAAYGLAWLAQWREPSRLTTPG